MVELGFSYKHVSIRALERCPFLRAKWGYIMADWDVRQLIWLDETSKDDRTCIKKVGWSYEGNRATVDAAFMRGDR